MTYISNRNYGAELALGNIPGREAFTRDFVSSDINSSGARDVWGSATAMTYLTAASTWEIVSDDPNDTAGGTGARIITVITFDADYNKVEQDVVMNGTSRVSLTGSHIAPDIMFVKEAGSSKGNEGLITLQQVTGAVAQGYISPLVGESKSSQLTVPAGYTMLISSVSLFVGKGNDCDFSSVITPFGSNQPDIYSSFGKMYQSSQAFELDIPTALPEKTRFKFAARSSQGTSIEVAIAMQFTLVENQT